MSPQPAHRKQPRWRISPVLGISINSPYPSSRPQPPQVSWSTTGALSVVSSVPKTGLAAGVGSGALLAVGQEGVLRGKVERVGEVVGEDENALRVGETVAGL